MDVRSGAKFVGLLAVVVVGCEYLPSVKQPLARPKTAGDVHVNSGLYDQRTSDDSIQGSELERMIARDVQALQGLQNQQPVYDPQQEQLQTSSNIDIPIQKAKSDVVASAKSEEVEWNKPRGRMSKKESDRLAAANAEVKAVASTKTAPDEIKQNVPGIVQKVLGNAELQTARSATKTKRDELQIAQSQLSDGLRQMIVDFRSEIFHQSSYSENPLRELLILAALPLIDPDSVLSNDTIEAINGLTDREREIFSRIQDYYVKLGRELSSDADSEEAVIKGLDDLVASLSIEPQLELTNPMLCTSVTGFGAYKAFGKNTDDRYSFLSQTSQQAVVYLEVENFTSKLNENSKWVTKLSQQLVIYNDKDGIPVWKQTWRPVVDVSGNKRNDFFVVQVITLTQRLGLGRYQLKISLRDELSGAESETVIEMEMVADPRLVTAGVTR